MLTNKTSVFEKTFGTWIASRRQRNKTMHRYPTIAAAIVGFALSVAAPAQTAGQDIKNAGHETKEATKDTAKATGKGVKTGARKTKHAVKRGTHATANATENGAAKVEEKTR
jgi:hypothetical protein